jgi:hypothetical protein
LRRWKRPGFTRAPERQPHDLQERGREARHRSLPAARILHPKVLKSILRDADLSIEDIEKLL